MFILSIFGYYAMGSIAKLSGSTHRENGVEIAHDIVAHKEGFPRTSLSSADFIII